MFYIFIYSGVQDNCFCSNWDYFRLKCASRRTSLIGCFVIFFNVDSREDNFWTEIFYFWRSICDICSHTLEVGYLVSEPHCCSTLQVTKPWMERRHVMSTHSPLRLHPDSILPQNRLLTQQSAAICVVWSARWQAQHFVSDYLGPHFVFTQTQLPVNAGFEVVLLSLSL